MEIYLIIIVFLCIVTTVMTFVILKKNKTSESQNTQTEINSALTAFRQELVSTQNMLREIGSNQAKMIELYNSNVSQKIVDMQNAMIKDLGQIDNKMAELVKNNLSQMEKLQQSNEKKLDEMRAVVDEKLNVTLQDRLNKSFAIVSEQLQAVTKGLGEMQNLASGVGDLKKVITNVKTRGTFGELQLGNILEQMLAPNQFDSQVNTNKENSDRVDFVVKLPGKDGKDLLLPIDAKFPTEDYTRLCDAYDTANLDEIAKCQKALEARIKEEAKSISKKYICPPNTTDFAIMYLATEGLYSEIVRNTTLVERLQQEFHILVCGPTTISALLNSLQMGFKTLAIEKRSAEIWNMLAVFKKEFTTYVDLLSKTQKKLSEATNTIEDATKKSQKISKQLSKVEDLGAPAGEIDE